LFCATIFAVDLVGCFDVCGLGKYLSFKPKKAFQFFMDERTFPSPSKKGCFYGSLLDFKKKILF
jgi:hypothetical protein